MVHGCEESRLSRLDSAFGFAGLKPSGLRTRLVTLYNLLVDLVCGLARSSPTCYAWMPLDELRRLRSLRKRIRISRATSAERCAPAHAPTVPRPSSGVCCSGSWLKMKTGIEWLYLTNQASSRGCQVCR
jgi:hypothetical protein